MATVHNIKDASALHKLVDSFAATGWRMAKGNVTGQLGGPMVYFCDVETGQLFVVATTRDAVPQMNEQLGTSAYTYDDVCNAVGTLIGDLSSGVTVLDDKTRGALLVGAALYISQTQSYTIAVTRGFQHPQFIVLRYRDHSYDGYLLRPVVLNSPAPLRPEQIESVAAEILTIDRRNHPERFPRAEVLQFRVKSRHDV